MAVTPVVLHFNHEITLFPRVEKFIQLSRLYSDILLVCGSQSPALDGMSREQQILWAGMSEEERRQYDDWSDAKIA